MSPLVAGAALLLAPRAAEAELDRFLADWARRMEGLETLEVRFTQEKRLRILKQPLVSRGTIRLRVKDRKLRCTVLDPAGKPESEVLAEEGRVRIFYPALQRLEVYDLAAGAAPPVSFPGLGSDVEALKRDFEVSLERAADGDRLLLKPRAPGARVKEIRLLLRDFEPRELVQVEASGDSVRLAIEEFRRNAPLRERDLEITVPPGTSEVRPLERKRPPEQRPLK